MLSFQLKQHYHTFPVDEYHRSCSPELEATWLDGAVKSQGGTCILMMMNTFKGRGRHKIRRHPQEERSFYSGITSVCVIGRRNTDRKSSTQEKATTRRIENKHETSTEPNPENATFSTTVTYLLYTYHPHRTSTNSATFFDLSSSVQP